MSREVTDAGLRVAITTNTLRPGGAEVQRLTLANGLAKRGHRVTLRCLQEFGELQGRLSSEVELVRLGWRSVNVPPSDITVCGTTNTELSAAVLSRSIRLSKKILCVVHNPVGEGAPSLKPIARRLMAFPDSIAALTPRQSKFLREFWGLSADVILPNGIDVNTLTVHPILRAIDVPEFTYGYIGRISSAHKGLDRTLEAFAALADERATLAIAGVGPDERALQGLASKLGVAHRVSWLGYQEPMNFFGRIGCLVLLSRFEAQPMVILECEAAGVPMILSSETGHPGGGRASVIGEGASIREYAGAMSAWRQLLSVAPASVTTEDEMVEGYLREFERMLGSEV